MAVTHPVFFCGMLLKVTSTEDEPANGGGSHASEDNSGVKGLTEPATCTCNAN